MSSTERLDVLRERNKDLMNQLKQQREKLERLTSCSQSHKREKDDEALYRRQADDMVTLTSVDGGLARATLAKPTVKFADYENACQRQTGIRHTVLKPCLTSKHGEGTSQQTDPSHSERQSPVQDRQQDMTPHNTKSCLANHSKEQSEVQSRVTFQSDECAEIPGSDRHLLGYDWIAGVLDAEDSLIERSDEFFNDLRIFRSLHKDECVQSPQAEFSEENHSALPLLTDKNDPDGEANTDTHQCTFSYRINSRLFPVPLHSQECCPVCKKHKSSHPHTPAEPALVRVSIPRSNILPPHKYKPHRRCSFDPSDSLGLPSHCLSGWSHTDQSSLPPPSSLDLQSCLNAKSSTEQQNLELKDLTVPTVLSDQISNMSQLARHNFQHFSHRKKLGGTSYPIH